MARKVHAFDPQNGAKAIGTQPPELPQLTSSSILNTVNDSLGGSLNAIAPVPKRRNSTLQLRRSSSISPSLIKPDRSAKHRSTRTSTTGANAVSSQIMPDGRGSSRTRSSLERSRDSSASRTKALSEFNIFLKILDEVAIHYVTLYFISITSSTVITKMEQSFTKYYANSQRRLYLRGLTALVIFMVLTFAYDYLVLWDNFNVSSSVSNTPTSRYVGGTKLPKFTLVVVLKVAIVLPVLFLTYFRARKHSYAEDFWLTWFCIAVVASYPLAYNKVTNDYGVSWVCLVIMYIYSCTPIRFFPCSVFCMTYLMIYVVVMLAYIPDGEDPAYPNSNRDRVSNETLYACLFYFLILLPSQSREFAIRVSYMSELMVLLQQEQLKMEETRSKSLLNSMLPESIVVQLQSGRELIADAYASVTVLFAEVCDFDFFSSKLKPQYVVELLNIIFYKFDKLVDVHHVHKVETIGAVYMVVGGCPDPIENHAELVANLALDMIRCIPEVSEKIARKPWGELVKNLNIRIGINSGALMAGVVGIRNPRFKLFGDTVNVASRMETTNLPGQIQITESTHTILCENYFTTYRGKVFVKGRGDMNTYFLRGKGNYIIPYPQATLPSPTPATHAGGPSATDTPPATAASSPTRRASLLIQTVQSIPEDVEGTPTPKAGDIPPQDAAAALVRGDDGAMSPRVTNARHPRRQNSRLRSGEIEKKLVKQSSLSSLLTIANAAKDAAAGSTGDAIISGHLARIKANEMEASSIAATPQGSFSSVQPLLQTERRGTLSALRLNTVQQMGSAKRSIVRENIFDIVEDAEENGNDNNNDGYTHQTEIMKLPKGLTRREVLLRVHGRWRDGLSQEVFEFEESYRLENRARWLRFFRLSITVFLILKPFMTLYQTVRLSTTRSFAESHLIFLLNFGVMYPVCIAYLFYTFSPTFRDFEQSTSVSVTFIIAVVLCAESVAANSLGHAYMSVLALYQCYFSNVSFLLRVLLGFLILALYLLTNLVIAPHFSWNSDTDQVRVGRNALYILIFFAGQAWVVFNSEFKQRINHYREITLNSQKQKLVEEEQRITKLLLNLLPETIVHKLKEDPEATIADFFDNVTVLFTDMVNFTAYSSKVSAMELVQFLNDMYTRFDTIAEKESLYKVEIIGDAYFVVGGCPIVSTTNALAVVSAAMDMFAALPLLRRNCGLPDLNIRIGVHSGPVLAGVVGSKDPRYHLFGETVTIAHFLESSGSPGRIHISESTWARMNKDTPGHGFKVEYHTLLSINGYPKKIRTYFVL